MLLRLIYIVIILVTFVVCKIMYKENERIKISQGYNRTTLAEEFHIDINELDIMKIWLDGDDTDLIMENR